MCKIDDNSPNISNFKVLFYCRYVGVGIKKNRLSTELIASNRSAASPV